LLHSKITSPSCRLTYSEQASLNMATPPGKQPLQVSA
jgi:hypothetical protein